MIYIDSCAIVKLVIVERESAALIEWLRRSEGQDVVTSALAEVEVPRTLLRNAPGLLGKLALVMERIDRVEINAPVRVTAAAYGTVHLRSLDAIHLATADRLVESGHRISSFVTYDKRLASVATDAGFEVVAPG